MNCRITLFVVLLLVTGYGTVFSRETPIGTIIPAKQVTVAKGQTAQLSVRAKIKKGFHIQANPAADEFLIPTTLSIKANEKIVPGKPVYPPGHAYRLKGSEDDLLTYEDEVEISLPVKVLDSAPIGNANLNGGLRLQPCDDRRCFPPRTIPVTISVKIVQP